MPGKYKSFETEASGYGDHESTKQCYRLNKLPHNSGTSCFVSKNIAPLIAAPFVQVEVTDQAGEKSNFSGLLSDIKLIAEVPGIVSPGT